MSFTGIYTREWCAGIEAKRNFLYSAICPAVATIITSYARLSSELLRKIVGVVPGPAVLRQVAELVTVCTASTMPYLRAH